MAIIKDPLPATGLTAAGTTITDALQLNAAINFVDTAAASSGVKLPPNAAVGSVVVVINRGANALNVYPATSTGTINGGAAGAAKSLAVTDYSTRSRAFFCAGSDVWVALGAAA